MLPPTRSPRYRNKEAFLGGIGKNTFQGFIGGLKNIFGKKTPSPVPQETFQPFNFTNYKNPVIPDIKNKIPEGTSGATNHIKPNIEQNKNNNIPSLIKTTPIPPKKSDTVKPTQISNTPEGNVPNTNTPTNNNIPSLIKNTPILPKKPDTVKPTQTSNTPEGNVSNTNTPTNNNTPSGAPNNTPQDPNNQNNFMQSVKDHFASDHFKNNANWYLGGAVGGAAALGAGGLATGYMLAPPKRRD